jgi:hypothetical protein
MGKPIAPINPELVLITTYWFTSKRAISDHINIYSKYGYECCTPKF